jgi:hypothetical protein
MNLLRQDNTEEPEAHRCECPRPGWCLCWLDVEAEDYAINTAKLDEIRVMEHFEVDGIAHVKITGERAGLLLDVVYTATRPLLGNHTPWVE